MQNATSVIAVAIDSPLNYTVNDTFSIGATFCEPDIYVAERARTLQLLVHGITYNRTYWDGLGVNGSAYSWVDFASSEGYPTLAIDRLGSGVSSHPDPLLDVQSYVDAEIIHQLVAKIQRGVVGPISDIVYVGHSYGSMIANLYLQKYPSEIETFLLTGFSSSSPGLAGILLSGLLPAWEFSDRYADLPQGYLATSCELGRRNSFFSRPGVDCSLEILRHDWLHMDTVTVGSMISSGAAKPAPEFTGKVYILNGNEDESFCGPGSEAIGPANCTAVLPEAASLFPAASIFNWTAIPNTGHCLQLHYSAGQAFKMAHKWLADIGY